jgi:hypothetical protein
LAVALLPSLYDVDKKDERDNRATVYRHENNKALWSGNSELSMVDFNE